MRSLATSVLKLMVAMVLSVSRWIDSKKTTTEQLQDGEDKEQSCISSSLFNGLDATMTKLYELIGGPKDGDHINHNKRLFVWLSENDIGALYMRDWDRDVYRFTRYLTVGEVKLVYEEMGTNGSHS